MCENVDGQDLKPLKNLFDERFENTLKRLISEEDLDGDFIESTVEKFKETFMFKYNFQGPDEECCPYKKFRYPLISSADLEEDDSEFLLRLNENFEEDLVCLPSYLIIEISPESSMRKNFFDILIALNRSFRATAVVASVEGVHIKTKLLVRSDKPEHLGKWLNVNRRTSKVLEDSVEKCIKEYRYILFEECNK